FYPTGDKRIPYKKYKINWSQLGLLVTKPQNLIHAAYNWGDSSGLDYDKVLSKLNTVLNLYGGNAERILIDKPNHERFYLHNPQLSNFNIEQLNISVLQYWEPFINNYKELNLNIIPVPKNDLSQTIDGLALQLAKAGTYESSFMLSPSFYASIDSELDKSDYLLLKILPDSSQFLTNFTASNFNTEFNFTYLPQPSVLLFGTRATSRLEFMGVDFSLSVLGEYNDPEFIIKIGNGKHINVPFLRFTFEPSNADNFIQKIIGANPFSLAVGGAVRWSSKFGFGFEGNTSFSIEIPRKDQRKNKDSSAHIQLETLRIAFATNGENTDLNVGLDFNLNLSVVKASIRNIGLKLRLSDKEGSNSKGIFDNLDFDLGFKFP